MQKRVLKMNLHVAHPAAPTADSAAVVVAIAVNAVSTACIA
jgi:hypothetical protein